jgi:hypothetical protein
MQTFSADGFVIVTMALIGSKKKLQKDVQLHVPSEVSHSASAIIIRKGAKNRWLLYKFSAAKPT